MVYNLKLNSLLWATFTLVFHLSAVLCAKSGRTNRSSILKDQKSIKFVIIGDWGGREKYPYFTTTQVRVARALDTIVKLNQAHFYVSTGDNFYPRGVSSINDPRFQATFENVYASKSHQKSWYVVAGNHDYNGIVAAQLAYTKESTKWVFPSNFYTLNFNAPDVKLHVDFVMIDTIKICGHEGDDALNQNLNLHPNITNAKEALQWIEETLKQSKADYLFVVGHYPVVSAGFHGPNKCLKEFLLPFLLLYNVTGYLSGHDHTLQHLKIFNDDAHLASEQVVHFVISGMGAKRDSIEKNDQQIKPAEKHFFYPKGAKSSGRQLFSKDKGGFVHCEVKKKQANFTFYDAFGRLLYFFNAKPRNSSKNLPVA